MPAVLEAIPWELAQDEVGVAATDLIALTARVLIRATQDQIFRQVTEAQRRTAKYQ